VTVDLDAWDADPTQPLPAPPDPLLSKARLLVAIEAQIEALEAQAKGLTYDIARAFPAGTGTHVKSFPEGTVTLTRSERWSWDKDTLKKIADSEPPGPVKDEIARAYVYNITIHKRDFAKLSPETQKALHRALTVKDGPFKIEVEDKT
jgi:hypothetical protein